MLRFFKRDAEQPPPENRDTSMEDTETPDAQEIVRQLRKEGKSLNEILDTLHKEHEIRMTFLELRMLVAEIEKSKPVEKKPPKKKPKKKDEPAETLGPAVTVDQVVQPGAQISGTVKFDSGASAKWFIDAIGRVSLALEPDSARPSEADMADFQRVLAAKLQGGA